MLLCIIEARLEAIFYQTIKRSLTHLYHIRNILVNLSETCVIFCQSGRMPFTPLCLVQNRDSATLWTDFIAGDHPNRRVIWRGWDSNP